MSKRRQLTLAIVIALAVAVFAVPYLYHKIVHEPMHGAGSAAGE